MENRKLQSKSSGKLAYIDGLKGTGALIVYLCHFCFAFYYALYSLYAPHAHTSGAVEVAIGRSPLNILYNGNFAVQLFMVASGFVLCIGYFKGLQTGADKAQGRRGLLIAAVKRYFRLMVPILIVNTLIFLLMISHLYKNTEAAVLTGSLDWFAGFNNFEPGYFYAFREAVWGSFLFGHNYFNGVLWTVKYLFQGAVLVYAMAAVLADKKWRYPVYAVLCLVLLRTDYAGMVIGFALSDLVYQKPEWVERLISLKWLSAALFIIGIYFGSYPSVGWGLEGSIYGFLPVASVFYHRVGAALIFAGVVLSPLLQRVFSGKFFRKMGEISFSWYLLHFPVIAVFSAAFTLKFYGTMNYHVLMLLNFILTTAIIFLVSEVFHRLVENNWNRFINNVFKR